MNGKLKERSIVGTSLYRKNENTDWIVEFKLLNGEEFKLKINDWYVLVPTKGWITAIGLEVGDEVIKIKRYGENK